MNEKVIAFVFEFVTHVINAGGYAGIIALITCNSCGIPIPSEIIMPFSGYLVYLGRFNLFLVAAAGAVGCNIGSAIAYWIGARGGRPLVERYGNWVLMSQSRPGPYERVLREVRIDRDLAGADDADRADFCRLSGRDRQNAEAAFSYLHFCGFLDLVFLPGLGWHEAWPGVAYRSAVSSRHSTAFMSSWSWQWLQHSYGFCGRT